MPSNIDWVFPSTGNFEDDGFNDPQIQFFMGDLERSIAKEGTQNTIDARRDPDQPARIVFELTKLPVQKLPGHETLLKTLKSCLEYEKGIDEATNFFTRGIRLLGTEKVNVLKISDFNTKGLTGADDDTTGNWYRLVKATGVSTSKGVGGGSFGIGKGAPFAASNLRCVFYSSVTEDGKPVFQGKVRLTSHKKAKSNEVMRGIGLYGISGYKSIRDTEQIPDFFRRLEVGTDIFIVGYEAREDWDRDLIGSMLHYFWLTIKDGDLEVEVRTGKKVININKDNLRERLGEYDATSALAYYDAISNWTEKFEGNLKNLGKVMLYVKLGDDYKKTVMTARKPKMLVDEPVFRALHESYAGVFLCTNDEGDALLRSLEPPAHDEWDHARHPKGKEAISEMKEFIREKLREMGNNASAVPEDIPGLDKYLPDSENRDELPRSDGEPTEPTDNQDKNESAKEIGANKEPVGASVSAVTRQGVLMTIHGEVAKFKPGHGRRHPKPSQPPRIPGEGAEGERIRTADINFRSFVQKTKSGLVYHLVIKAKEDCEGSVKLAAVGDDGNYPIEISSASSILSSKKYKVDGSIIRGFSLPKGKVEKVAVKLTADKKYALGIETYEG